MQRMLSVDGGKVRGMSSLLILRGVMDIVQQETSRAASKSLRACDVFELIVGTGTGGISAIILGRMQRTVGQVIKEDIDMSDAVFQSPSRLSTIIPVRPLSDDKVLEDYVQKVLSRRLHDAEAFFFESRALNVEPLCSRLRVGP
jgi:hypothetical protein